MGGIIQQECEDPLHRLHKAHSSIAQILMQVDDLVLKAHRLSACKQISSRALCNLSEILENTASSLQEWIPRFENAAQEICTEDLASQDDEISTLIEENKEGDKEGNEFSKGKASLTDQSENSSESVPDLDGMFAGKENVLSDSPLVPWLDKVQFFILTPMAKQKKDFLRQVLSSRSAFKGHESLSREKVLFAHADIIPVNLSPSLDTCADNMQSMPSPLELHKRADIMQNIPSPLELLPMPAFDPCMLGEERILEDCTVSAAATPSHLVRHHSVEDTDTVDIASPSRFQSLVKRYSNYFEAHEHFPDSSPMPPVTPAAVKQRQASEEGIEITEYFTAFSPPRSIAPYISRSRRSHSSLLSVNSSPQSKVGVGDVEHNTPMPQSKAGADNGEHNTPMPQSKAGSHNVKHNTPMPFQSLMKRYSQFLHTEEERNEVTDSALTLTPMLVRSPPKTCIFRRPNHKDTAVGSRKSTFLLLKSPFTTPGLPNKAIDCAFYEDMDLTTLKKHRQPLLPTQSERTPSSDMQFATMKKALNSIKRTPLVELQLSTVRKAGAPLPGEQTLKRELWCRMEAEFASMAHVCKSLFSDSQVEAPNNAKAEKAEESDRQQRGWNKLGPRAVQLRDSSLVL